MSRRPLPKDPLIRELVLRARQAKFGRRGLMRGFAAGAAALGASTLAACSSSSGPGDGSGGTVRWGNWTYYLDYDEDEGTWPTLDAFMEQTNISVEYYEAIDDNKMFVGTIKDQLELEQDTGYDVFCLTDSSLVRLHERGQLREFDRSLTPNANEQMIDMVKQSSWDPDRQWTIPYQSGMTGLVYNTELYPQGIKNVSDLWHPDLAGKINLLSEQDDTVSLVMLEHGVDISGDWGDDEFFTALEEVEKHVGSAVVKGNSYVQDLESGAVVAGMAWSGDVAVLNSEAGEEIWKFVVPEAGATLFIDSFSMPVATEASDQVHELIEYYYEPEVAAEVAAYVEYVTPVAGAKEAMEKIDPELAANTLVFPDEEMSALVFDMRALTSEEDNRYAQAYQKVLGN
ncbi:MAG: ABC transporter substrate-binding protein [Leucobacter sp.]